jgi:rare lipoprotein A
MKFIGNSSALLCAFVLASCGSSDGKGEKRVSSLPPAPAAESAPDFPIKVGDPFTVGGKTYTPQDIANYDEVGYASWYGAELEGRPTANGETFVSAGVSAAHKTLPMPSYVEVTALDTGRTIVVRVNDRGPFANDRIIDLSAGAASELGITGQGVAGVRVRRVNPPEQDRSVLRAGRAAPARADTPQSLLKVLREKLAQGPRPSAPVQRAAAPAAQPSVAVSPSPLPTPTPAPTQTNGNGRFVREGSGARAATPVPAPVRAAPPVAAAPPIRPQAGSDGRFVRQRAGEAAPVANDGRFVRQSVGQGAPQQQSASVYVVQIGAYGSQARAEELARRAGARVQASADGRVFRVRFGPYASIDQAEQALAGALARGYSGARVYEE